MRSIPLYLRAHGNKTVNELETLNFTAEASDSDIPVQILTFSLVDAPLGATSISATGAFSWTPAEAQGLVLTHLQSKSVIMAHLAHATKKRLLLPSMRSMLRQCCSDW